MNETTMWLSSPRDDAGWFAQMQIIEASGTERLGQLYELDLELLSPGGPLDLDSVLDVPLTLHLRGADGTERAMHGIAARVSDRLAETDSLVYRLRLVPRAWRLSLTRTTEIFMDLSVPEVITTKLERAGLVAGEDFELRLRSSYPGREYVVQYDESDLSFVQRLAEHVGITLCFVQGDERECLVLADHNDAFPELGGDPVAFHPRGEKTGVFELSTTTSTLPARYAVKDYNYRTPQVALLADEAIPEGKEGLVYEYGGHFKTPDEAQQLAGVRAEEVACGRTVLEGRAIDVRLAAGARLRLEGHPRGELELLVTEVTHRYRNTVAMHAAREGAERAYECAFGARLQRNAYRPPRVTPKPRIHGCITAQIESTSDGPYAELDDEGRYHVRFLFDVTDSSRGGASRLVRMAQPHAGPGYGFHFPLRHGVEVLITFIDGDPDRPIISTAVPNPQTPSVVGSGNGTRNIIRTGGGNEINIDDTEGGERIKMSTPFGGSSFQLGAPNSPSAGAALSTTESYNAVAGSAVTTATAAASTFADIVGCWASGDIVAMAGATNILSALMSKAPDIIAGVAKTVDGVLDTAAAAEQVPIEEAKRQAAEAEEQAKELRRRQAANPNMAEEYGRQAEAAEHRAAVARARAKALGDVKAKNDLDRREVKSYSKIAQNLAGADKAASSIGDTWSKISKLAAKGADAVAVGAASFAAGAGTGAAAVGRIPGAVPAPAAPRNVQAAAGGAALVGGVSAMVAGTSEAACVSPGVAILAGAATAMVKSPGAVEVAGIGRTLVTSGGAVDIKSGTYKCACLGTATVTAGGAMTMTTKSSLVVAASSSAKVTSGGAMKITAKGTMDVTASSELELVGGPSARVKAAKASLVSDGSSLQLDGAATLKTNGEMRLLSSASAVVKGSDVTLSGDTKVTGNCHLSKDCHVKGRVYLG